MLRRTWSRARPLGYAAPVRCFPLSAAVCLGFVAYGTAQADDAVLHEYVPHLDPEEVTRALRANLVGTAGNDEAGPAKGDATGPKAASAPAPDNRVPHSENFRPDRQTSLEAGLDYYEAFNPAIAPFKRMLALDATRLDVDGKTPVLGVYDARRTTVSIEAPDAAPPDARPRDRFKGEVDLDFRDERSQRLPSVSPESRILGMATTPHIAVRVERDGADNYFLRAEGELPEGPVHVSFLTDAPRAYFAALVPRIPLRSLTAEVPPLAPSIARRALRFAAQLGITPQSDLRNAIETLTKHFRAFVESSTPPQNTGDLYLDLVRSSKGLCRHRAYGFVVTAHALGIPARFVQNEAHSWVEVRLEGAGFLRIDLGGAAHGLTAHNLRDQPSYIPAQPDTLPRPESYRQSYAQAAARNPAQKTVDAAGLTGRWLPQNTSAPQRTVNPPSAAADRSMSQETDSAANPGAKTPLRVILDDRRMSSLRGGKLVLTGRMLDDAERGVADLRVEVWITRDKQRERMLLGVSVSDGDGYFRAAFGVPPDLAVGDYRLVVVSGGDARHLPVIAQ
jgi:hypothetical protein